jgi:hypothetical protein
MYSLVFAYPVALPIKKYASGVYLLKLNYLSVYLLIKYIFSS